MATKPIVKENTLKFNRKGALALPSYSIKGKKTGEPFFINVESEITTKQQTKADGELDTDEHGKVKEIHSVLVTDLVTGETGDMVLPFIIKKAFDDVIARDKKIAGHAFELEKGKLINRTNEWTVYELDI